MYSLQVDLESYVTRSGVLPPNKTKKDRDKGKRNLNVKIGDFFWGVHYNKSGGSSPKQSEKKEKKARQLSQTPSTSLKRVPLIRYFSYILNYLCKYSESVLVVGMGLLRRRAPQNPRGSNIRKHEGGEMGNFSIK